MSILYSCTKTNDPSRPNVQANKNIQIRPPRMRNSWGACMGMWRVTWARVSNGGDIVWIDNSLNQCVGIMLLVFPLRVSYHSSLAHPSILPHYRLYLHPSLVPHPKSLVLDRYKIRAPLELVIHTTNKDCPEPVCMEIFSRLDAPLFYLTFPTYHWLHGDYQVCLSFPCQILNFSPFPPPSLFLCTCRFTHSNTTSLPELIWRN